MSTPLKELTIDQAYELIDRHVESIQKLRHHIEAEIVRRDQRFSDELPPPRILTVREMLIARKYATTSLSAAEIAQDSYVSLNTVKSQLRAVYRKLGVGNRSDLARALLHLDVGPPS